MDTVRFIGSINLSKLSPRGNFHHWSKRRRKKKKGRAVRNDLGEPTLLFLRPTQLIDGEETSLATIPRSFRSHRRR